MRTWRQMKRWERNRRREALSRRSDQTDDEARRRRLRGCVGKRHYRTGKRANETASEMASRFGDTVRAYPCPFCGSWHLGHDRRRQVEPVAADMAQVAS